MLNYVREGDRVIVHSMDRFARSLKDLVTEVDKLVKRGIAIKFGKKIFEKIMDKAKPTFEDEKPLNVFDPFEGADFKLRMRQVDGFPNYDTSVFSDPKPIDESDDEILAILNQIAPLS